MLEKRSKQQGFTYTLRCVLELQTLTHLIPKGLYIQIMQVGKYKSSYVRDSPSSLYYFLIEI